ncbi:MAG: flagellar protein FliT [Halorhodospira sp.]
MLRQAEKGDWRGVMERDRLRRVQADRLPADPEHPEAALVRETLRQVLVLDRQVRLLMQRERDRLGAASRDEQQGREAQQAYTRFSR